MANKVIWLFFAQALLCVFGTQIFVVRVNPIALILISGLMTWYAARSLAPYSFSAPASRARNGNALLYAVAAVAGLLIATIPLQQLWLSMPDPGKSSDVLPQLQGQADLFFSGQFPYQRIPVEGNHPFPVYMPLHWGPFLLNNLMGTDVRWPSFWMLVTAVGIAGFFLRKAHPDAPDRWLLPATTVVFALPLWVFIKWAKAEIGLSAEGIVVAWYLLLAVGLAVRNHPLILIGLIGGILSRYTFLFWLPLFAGLLWWYMPKKQSVVIWGTTFFAVMLLFVLPFLVKDFSILEQMKNHYNGCAESSWVRPDAYTFRHGLSMNIHLREWLGGTPADNFAFRHWPQFAVQLLLLLAGLIYYKRSGHQQFDIYTYSLLALSLMPMLFYLFSPMLFQYYMLMPLYVSAVLCWKVIACKTPTPPKILCCS